MREKKIKINKPSIKIVPLANGLMPEATAKIVFPWFGLKYPAKHMPEPENVENCLRLIPIKLEIRNMLKGRLDDFVTSVDILDVQEHDASNHIMIPSIIEGANYADNVKFSQIWQEAIDAIYKCIMKLGEVSTEAANGMGDLMLSQFLAANIDITITAWDLRSYLIEKFEDAEFDLEDSASPGSSIFAQLLFEEIQVVWPWLVADIGFDADSYGETIH